MSTSDNIIMNVNLNGGVAGNVHAVVDRTGKTLSFRLVTKTGTADIDAQQVQALIALRTAQMRTTPSE